MQILSHRGIGFGYPENSAEAFKSALANGFGLEIDVRLGKEGEVVISHDPPKGREVKLVEVVNLLQSSQQVIAVHLKEQDERVWRPVIQSLQNNAHCFLFDVTIETAQKIKSMFPRFPLAFSVGEDHFAPTIYSLDEVISLPECDYIWWDEWVEAFSVYNDLQLRAIKESGKQVHVISPELHKHTHHLAKTPEIVWERLISMQVESICTDFPQRLKEMYEA